MAKVALPPERVETKDGNEQPLVAYATPLLYCMAAWKSMQNRGYLLVGVAVRRDYPVMTQSYTIPPADYEMWKRGEPMNETTLFDYPYRLFLMERLEFVLLCQDELEAKVLRIVEYEMLKAKEVWQALAEA